MRFSRLFAVALFVFVAGVLSLVARPKTKPKTPPKISLGGYTSWREVTQRPVKMDPATAMLCAAPPPTSQNVSLLVKGTGGPHAKKFIRVYVNKMGEGPMMTSKHPRFPAGTVIVKQKLPLIKPVKGSLNIGPQISSTPELLKVMLKHAQGYDSANGDWEYMVTDGTGKKVAQQGKIESCQNCHRAYSKTDYVVRSYLPLLTSR